MLCSDSGVGIDYLSGFISMENARSIMDYCTENNLGTFDAWLFGFVGLRYRMENGSLFLQTIQQDRDRYGNERNADEHYLQVSSELANDIAPLICTPCRFTRIDLKTDVLFDKDEMSVEELAYLAELKLKCKQTFISSSKAEENGATLYLKDRRSSFFIRIYEKGKKEKHELEYVRIEVQVNKQLANSVWEWILEGKMRDIFLQLWSEATEGLSSFDLFGEKPTYVDLELEKDRKNRMYESIERQILSRLRKLYGSEKLVYEILNHVMKEMHDGKRYSFTAGEDDFNDLFATDN